VPRCLPFPFSTFTRIPFPHPDQPVGHADFRTSTALVWRLFRPLQPGFPVLISLVESLLSNPTDTTLNPLFATFSPLSLGPSAYAWARRLGDGNRRHKRTGCCPGSYWFTDRPSPQWVRCCPCTRVRAPTNHRRLRGGEAL